MASLVNNARSLILFLAISALAACGGGGSSAAPGSSTVGTAPPAPSALSYASPAQATVGVSLSLSPAVTAAVSAYTVSPALPTGLALNTTSGVISGMPTAATAQASYTVTAANSSGSTTFSLSLTVNPAAPGHLSYAGALQASVGVPITPLSPTVTGTVTGFAVSPALPAGLALGATSGVISGTPTAAIAQASYTITASNAGGSATYSLSVTVQAKLTPSSLAIAAVSNSSPMALTPLYLSTAGLDPTQPATLNLTTSTGYSATLSPMRIQSDGTIVVAMPLDVNFTTGATQSYSAALTVTQGTQTSAPVNLTVQDIPPLNAYGTSLGSISHSMFVFQALQLAESANEVQSIQMGAAPATDVSQLLSDLAARQNAVIFALSEIDAVMTNNSIVIPAGTLPDGTTVQFDQTSLAMMDRIIGLYLSEVFSTVSLSPSHVSAMLQSQRQDKASVRAASIESLTGNLSSVTSVGTIAAGIQNAQQSCSTSGSVQGCASDLSGALGAGISQLGAALNGAAVVNRQLWFAQAVGAVGAAVSTASTTGQVFGDLAAFSQGVITQDSATMNAAVAEMRGLDQLTLADALLSLAAAPEFAGLAAANGTLAAGSAVISFVKYVVDQAQADADKADRTATLSLAQAAEQKAAQQAVIGMASGTVTAANNSAGMLPILTGIGLQPFGTGGTTVGALADPSGAYQMDVPLAVSGTSYSSLIVGAFNPTTGAAIGSDSVDLSGLTSTSPQILSPIVQGVSVQASCTVTQVNAWNQACLNTYNSATAACNSLPTLIEQNQCINAALSTWEGCDNGCVP